MLFVDGGRITVSIQIEFPPQLLAAIRQLTNSQNDSEAIEKAAREYLRISRLRELKSASGMVDFDLDWQQLEALELQEPGLPT
jgi:metal-responsive CopG/Arc/MetJ family transcriptional regulator